MTKCRMRAIFACLLSSLLSYAMIRRELIRYNSARSLKRREDGK